MVKTWQARGKGVWGGQGGAGSEGGGAGGGALLLLRLALLPARTMNTLFQPLLTLATRASTIWETHRMMSSRISSALEWRMTTTNGRRKSFCAGGRGGGEWGRGRHVSDPGGQCVPPAAAAAAARPPSPPARLEGVVCQLVALQELGGQLAQRVHRVHGHLQVAVAAHVHEKVGQHRPDAAPHQPVRVWGGRGCIGQAGRWKARAHE